VLGEASHSEGDTGYSPLQSRRAQRDFLGTTVYKVSRWLTLVSKFPSWPQFGLVIPGILKIPVMLVLIYLSYSPSRTRSKAVRGWLLTPTFIPHLGQATRAPGTVNAVPHLSQARIPGTVKRYLIAKLIAERLRLYGNSWDCKAVRGGGSCTTTMYHDCHYKQEKQSLLWIWNCVLVCPCTFQKLYCCSLETQ